MTSVITSQRPAGIGIAVTSFVAAAADDLLAMHDRCSPQSRFRRWHGHVCVFPPRYLSALLASTDEQLAVLARNEGDVVGFASAARVDSTTREIGILVEDAWQRRGVGGALLKALVAQCVAQGTTRLRAEVLADDAALLRPLRSLGPLRSELARGVISATVLIE